MRLRPIGWNAVGARQHRGGEIGHSCRVRPHIGALIVENLILERENMSLAIDCRADVMVLLARMIGSDEMLAAVLDPLYRPLHA